MCFNKNIEWTEELKLKWDVGFDNPFIGYTEGMGSFPVEFDEKDQLNSLLPLNIFTEAEEFNSSYIKYWSRVIAPTQDWENEKDFEEPFQYDLDKFKNNIPRLGFEEFRKLYESDKRLITWNESIWKNTFKEILTTEIVNGILNREKYGSR